MDDFFLSFISFEAGFPFFVLTTETYFPLSKAKHNSPFSSKNCDTLDTPSQLIYCPMASIFILTEVWVSVKILAWTSDGDNTARIDKINANVMMRFALYVCFICSTLLFFPLFFIIAYINFTILDSCIKILYNLYKRQPNKNYVDVLFYWRNG